MPDLNDDLFSSFKDEGAPMRPLPASEVRRRGDRMRRRNNTLATVGGVAAALVAIATPLAIVTNQGSTESDSDSFVATQPGEVTWKQQIPSSVAVGDGLAGLQSPASETTAEPGVATVEICGETAFDAEAGTVDVAGATYDDPESNGNAGNARTLALYADQADAEAAVDEILTAVDGCTSEAGNAQTLTYALADLPGIAADEAFLITRDRTAEGEDFASSADYYVLVRTGNAVLVTETPGSARNPEQADFEEQRLADLAVDMQTFAESANALATTDGEADLGTSIPDDFPLLDGFPEQSDNPVGREGPSRDLAVADYDAGDVACGVSPSGLPTPTDTLLAGYRENAGAQLRRVMTFDSEQDATAYVDSVAAVYRDCPLDEETVGVGMSYEVQDVPGVGDQTVSVVGHPAAQGETGPGYRVVQLVRVGSAVLHFTASYDGADPVDPATAAADLTTTYVNGNSPVIDAM